MIRLRRSSIPLLFVPVALLVGCGVAADTTAATVAGRSVDVDDVTTLAGDPAFTGGGELGDDASTLPGDLARSVLLFEIERVAWLAEVERFGLQITDEDLRLGAQQLDQQAAGQGAEFGDRTREMLVEYFAAQQVLGQRLAALDPTDDADLRTIYDATAALWDRVCVAVAQVPPDSDERVDELIDAGTGVEGLADRLEGAQLAATPDQCLPVVQLPAELREALESAPIGRTTEVVEVAGVAGPTHFVARVDERRRIGFGEAGPELIGIAETVTQQGGAASWVQFQVIAAEIDPRYGSGVAPAGGGQLAITPPPAPVLPVPALGDLGGATVADVPTGG